MSKELGAEAELRAALALTERGHNVSWPSKDTTYDLVAEKNGKCVRIQVKSTSSKHYRRDQYNLTCRKADGKSAKQRYAAGDFDFLLAYVSPEDKFYIVPIEAIQGSGLALYPHRSDLEGQYERFKEAWKLLTNDE